MMRQAEVRNTRKKCWADLVPNEELLVYESALFWRNHVTVQLLMIERLWRQSEHGHRDEYDDESIYDEKCGKYCFQIQINWRAEGLNLGVKCKKLLGSHECTLSEDFFHVTTKQASDDSDDDENVSEVKFLHDPVLFFYLVKIWPNIKTYTNNNTIPTTFWNFIHSSLFCASLFSSSFFSLSLLP